MSIDVQLLSIACCAGYPIGRKCHFLVDDYKIIVEEIRIIFRNVSRNEKLLLRISIEWKTFNGQTSKAESQFHILNVEFYTVIFIFRIL